MLKLTPPCCTVAPSGALAPGCSARGAARGGVALRAAVCRLMLVLPGRGASGVVGFGGRALAAVVAAGRGLLAPAPAGDLRHVLAVLLDVLLVLDELVADGLLGPGGAAAEPRHAIDHVLHQVEAIEVVEHAHV